MTHNLFVGTLGGAIGGTWCLTRKDVNREEGSGRAGGRWEKGEGTIGPNSS